MFCVECGKEIDIFREGVCIDCYLKTHKFTDGPSIIDITCCPHCGNYKYKNMWVTEEFDIFIKRIIKNTFDIKRELENVQIDSICQEEKERINCKIIFTGKIDNVTIREEHDVYIRFKNYVCDVCSRRFGGYHEAIVQIRSDKRSLTKNELETLKAEVEKLVKDMYENGYRTLFIADIDEKHGGLDFFISDKSAANIITKKIFEKYGGEIKQSSKNIGMKDSKQLYRMTYLIRLPYFRKDDFILNKKSLYFVSSISSNKVHTMDISFWIEQIFEIRELDQAKVIGGLELAKEMILLSQTDKEVQVMDPVSYRTIEIRKPKDVFYDSKMIKVVKVDDSYYLFPKNSTNDKYQ